MQIIVYSRKMGPVFFDLRFSIISTKKDVNVSIFRNVRTFLGYISIFFKSQIYLKETKNIKILPFFFCSYNGSILIRTTNHTFANKNRKDYIYEKYITKPKGMASFSFAFTHSFYFYSYFSYNTFRLLWFL